MLFVNCLIAGFIIVLPICLFLLYYYLIRLPKKRKKIYDAYIENEAIKQIDIENKIEELKNNNY